MKRGVFLASLLTVSPLLAQQEPEVRRAQPVNPPEVRRAEPIDPNTYPNPAWVERVRRAEPVATPEPTPVATPVPVATPIPIATPIPMEPEPTPREDRIVPPEPAEPEPTPATAEEPPPQADEEPGDQLIRLAPAENLPTGNQNLLAGNGFYRRKMYDMAIPEYEKFLISEPHADGRDGAMFRLAESHRFLGNDRAAKEGYQRLLAEFREGEYVGSAAYRLAEIFYADGNYAVAVEMFRKAEENAPNREIKLAALFYQANALEKLQKPREAADAFRKLVAVEEDNPFRDNAQFRLAELAARRGSKQEAFLAYESLSENAEKAEMKAEAMVKAAALAAELGKPERAKELFDKALTMPAIGDWRGVAKLGVLRLAYEAGLYEESAKISEKELSELPPDALPEALVIMANSQRQLGKFAEALEIYDRVMREFPRSDAAKQAQFQRLVCLDATGAEGIASQIDAFLENATDPRERAQAILLKAETLFKAGDYAGAMPLYEKVLGSKLPERLLEPALYKLGWCMLQTGNADGAVQTFSQYLQKYPKSELAAAALAQRALAKQQLKAYDAAMTDFQKLINDYPNAKERELAMQQKALILGQQEKFDEMTAAFSELLKEYPETKAAAQAEYWIGWAAFQKKDYPAAIEHLSKSRDLDKEGFGERAGVKILLAHYYNENLDGVVEEAGKLDTNSVPAEVMAWLGEKYYAKGDFKKANEFLSPVLARNGAPISPDVLLALAKARLALKDYDGARDPVQRYLAEARDPVSRARGLLASARLSLGTGNYADADKLVEEALLLQPEGKYNAEARMLAAEVLTARGDHDGAARAYATVAVLYDDPEITPQALKRAVDAFRRAGKPDEAEKALKELRERFPEEQEKSKTAAQN